MKRLSILALSAVVAAVLAGCQGQSRIQPVAEQPVISVADPSAARPVQFSRIVIDLRRGEQIGTFREGRGYCSQPGTLIYRGGRMTFDDRELSETFRHELERANYRVVGDPDALFDDASSWKAEFLVAGRVTHIDADLCYAYDTWQKVMKASGAALMDVDWQVYSRLDRSVVYRQHTQGRGELALEQASTSGESDVLLNAFAQATRNLLADRGFYERVAGQSSGSSATAAPSYPPAEVVLASRTLFTGRLEKNIDTVRQNVVTIFAGDGHGSGFFVDRAGHVLTNEHVVRTAEHVKVKLSSGRETIGTVIATDRRRDVALIKVEESASGLPVRLDRPKIGSEVYAIGSPLDADLSATVTRGIVSAYRQRDGLNFIQSDVSVLPGNSGGPLLDASGNIIGVTVSGVEMGDVPVGVNFFIPIGEAIERLGIHASGSST